MSEMDYKLQLKKAFESYGWEVYMEVPADHCITWKHPESVDIIVFNPETGIKIGIEAKDCNCRAGGVFAEAFEQIKRYSKYTYFTGLQINFWAIATSLLNPDLNMNNSNVRQFIQGFFNHYGIAFIDGTLKNPKINFQGGNGEYIIKLDSTQDKSDLKKIQEYVKKRFPQGDS